MALSFGNMFASLTLESASFMSGIEAARKSIGAVQKQFADTGKKMQQIGAVMTVGITAPFTGLLATAVPAATESAQAMAQVNAALASMGPVAGRTADQLQALASGLMKTSTYDDDDILRNVTANLLTFGNISGPIFDRAQQDIVDMATRLKMDLQPATILVAKAINDPANGLMALGRVGAVSREWVKNNKEMIAGLVASGDRAKAQAIILGELERQTKGAAQAQRDATPGADLKNAWDDFNETVGAVALKVLPGITAALAGVLEAFNALPAPVQTGAVAIVAIGAGLGPVIAAMGTLVTVLGTAIPAIVTFAAGVTGLTVAETAATGVAYAFGVAIGAALGPIAAVAGAVALVVAAVNHWDEIKAVGARVVDYMRQMYVGVKTWIGDKLNAVWAGVKQGVQWVADKFKWLDDVVVRHSYIPDMVDSIGQHMARLQQTLVAPAQAATQSAAQAFDALAQRVAPILDRLFPEQAEVNRFAQEMADLEAYAKQAGWTAAELDEARGRLAHVDLGEWATTIDSVLPKLGDLRDGARDAFADIVDTVTRSVQQIVGALRGGDFLSAVGGLFDAFGQLASGGVFGKGLQTSFRGLGMQLNGARAAGGPVLAGGSYLVGERGPEILRMGSTGGRVIPNDQIGSGRGGMIFDLRGAVVTERLLAQVNDIAAGHANDAVTRYDTGRRKAAARALVRS